MKQLNIYCTENEALCNPTRFEGLLLIMIDKRYKGIFYYHQDYKQQYVVGVGTDIFTRDDDVENVIEIKLLGG